MELRHMLGCSVQLTQAFSHSRENGKLYCSLEVWVVLKETLHSLPLIKNHVAVAQEAEQVIL